MEILKRNGRKVMFNPNKITQRIRNRSDNLKVDSDKVSIAVISQIADNMTTRQLDELCIETCASKVAEHPDYSILAARIFVTSLRKYTPETFSESVGKIAETTGLLSPEFYNFVQSNGKELDKMIKQDRDFNHDIFGLKTLERAYLIRSSAGEVIERPQYMWMRTAIEVTGFKIDKIKETYDMLSEGYYTHATPTLFNSGTDNSQLSSCFLLANDDDSIKGIYKTITDCAKISQWAGGIGVHVHNVRAKGSHIKGTNGVSNGLVPMLKVFNETARYVDQGGGKRKGSFAVYLEPWHADIYDFLELKKNHGKEEMRARDLFYAMWIPDEFMARVEADEDWHLFCPNELLKAGLCLQDVYGEDFEEEYRIAVDRGLARETVKARDLWEKIVIAQIETGNPYMAYKDAVNRGSNQKNLGTIKSSNLCIEINEYTDRNEQAVCNLASIALPKMVTDDKMRGKRNGKYPKRIDLNMLRETVRVAIRNLDNVIDANYYPTPETETSNNKHRPVGLGVQGLADVFAMMDLPFYSEEARKVNLLIFEAIYYFALEMSCELAIEKGPYSSFYGSPASKGILQFDMYEDTEFSTNELGEQNFDWDKLKQMIKDNGLRNSLLLAMMPTASTSQILGNNECFEPFNSNLSTRGTLAGTFIINNKHLVADLEDLGLWNEDIKNKLMAENGSVQNIPEIPTKLKEKYKTAYEMSQKVIIDMAADRQKFICQAQSMNLFLQNATVPKLSSMHLYAWKKGLKTGMYYLRTKSAVDAKKFTLEATKKEEEVIPIPQEDFAAMIAASRDAQEDDDLSCLMCGA